MALALICMIVGVVFYGYIIASAAASLANADVQRARYQQKLDTIGRFLKVRMMSNVIFTDVRLTLRLDDGNKIPIYWNKAKNFVIFIWWITH